MGVAASMSISVIADGRLWGLIACHHYSPKVLSLAERTAAELFGQFFSLRLHALKQKRSLDTATEARRALDRFLRLASNAGDIETMLRENLPDFARLLPCDGVGLWFDGSWSEHGVTPPPEAIPALADFVSVVAHGRIWSTQALSRHHPAAGAYHREASGLLAVPLSQLPRDYLFFFRRELVQTLNWGGNPDKTYASGPHGDRLTPRKSFAIWKQTVERQAQPWTEADLEIAEATRAAAVEIVLRHNELMIEERGQRERAPAHAQRGAEPPRQEHPRGDPFAGREPARWPAARSRLMSPRSRGASRRSPTPTTRSPAAMAAGFSPSCSAPNSAPTASRGRSVIVSRARGLARRARLLGDGADPPRARDQRRQVRCALGRRGAPRRRLGFHRGRRRRIALGGAWRSARDPADAERLRIGADRALGALRSRRRCRGRLPSGRHRCRLQAAGRTRLARGRFRAWRIRRHRGRDAGRSRVFPCRRTSRSCWSRIRC